MVCIILYDTLMGRTFQMPLYYDLNRYFYLILTCSHVLMNIILLSNENAAPKCTPSGIEFYCKGIFYLSNTLIRKLNTLHFP